MFRLTSPFARTRRLVGTPRHTSSLSRGSDPLRILFCGSDEFSCASLRALHREHVRDRGLVEALDVMVLPARKTGRGLKMVSQVPCKTLAEELGLRIHQRETFRMWDLPHGTNLVVVVSFGLFVPRRILSSAKYGGLNVHPSLLPDLRGPAPIHHALLRGDTHMGISLQTLDDEAFDHGTILAQTPSPGMPIPADASFQGIMHDAATKGAAMLVQGLRDGLHVPPHRDVGWKAAHLEGRKLQHAPKITKADGRIEPEWTAEQFARRIRVLGSVWTNAVNEKGVQKRVILLDAEPVMDEAVPERCEEATLVCEYEASDQRRREPVRHERRVITDDDGSCLIHVCGRTWIRVTKVKVDGKPQQMAAMGLKSLIRRK
ncbi:hypothetical protein C2857_002821 [Epichloe festucae Fl1]|uniref:methionyl-tRNA formyltransferase n=1 Tax=Epichloe festucae (strain Fl1) TaxID=877507 RepID=A0A7S9KUL0_EPIFF|nr:hypothetical protein C2857_002821 [Epichloe festucae Fl1]